MADGVREYLTTMMTEGFNKFCIDCKTGLSTHCLVSFGSFVCGKCASVHKAVYG